MKSFDSFLIYPVLILSQGLFLEFLAACFRVFPDFRA
jgi:hypothetical protein